MNRIFGYVIASVVYYGLNYISPQTVSLVDVAVYPAQLGDPPIIDTSDAASDELKDPTITREKEIV
jgi:hypothetical protein